MARPIYDIVLKDKKFLTGKTLELLFECERSDFYYVAGQFVSLQFVVDGNMLKRSYSIATTPEQFQLTNQFAIAATMLKDGLASGYLKSATKGTKFKMTGPFGALTLQNKSFKRLFLIGTGTGVSPYKSMLTELGNLAHHQLEINIIMGVRKREDLFYCEDFSALTHLHAHVSFIKCLSQEKSHAADHYFSGRVTEFIKTIAFNHETDLIYLCGNPHMIDDVMQLMKQQNFPAIKIKREKYVLSR